MRGAGSERTINAIVETPRLKGRALIYALPFIIKKQGKQELFDLYIAESLRLISENTAKSVNGQYMSVKWKDVSALKKADERTGDEIAADVIERLGLTFEDKS